MDISITIWSLCLLFGSVTSLFLFFIFLLQKLGEQKPRWIFASLLLVFSIILFDHSLRLSDFYKFFPYGLYISDSLWYLIAPLLWLYIKTRIGNNSLKWLDLLHFVPFLYFVYRYRGLPFYSAEIKIRILENYIARGAVHTLIIKIFILFMMIQILFYLVACFVHLIRYKKKNKQNFANNEIAYLILIQRVIGFFSFYFIIEFTFSTYRNFANIQNRFLENWSLVMWTFFILALCAVVIKDPKLVFDKFKLIKDKYGGLDVDLLKNRLLKHTDSALPFLDKNLTLNHLAESIGLSSHELSYILNKKLDTTFYEFVNTRRVKHAAKLLQTGEHLKLSIFGVAQASGFKSKASFYTFFKKEFNATPTKYIKELKLPEK